MDTDKVSRKHAHPETDTEEDVRKSTKYTAVAHSASSTPDTTDNTVGPSPDGNKDIPPVGNQPAVNKDTPPVGNPPAGNKVTTPVGNPPAGNTAPTPVGIPPVTGQIPSYADLVKQGIAVPTPYYVGKATITADVSTIDKFSEVQVLQDFKRQHPQAFKTLRGCGLRGVGRRTLEMMFATPQDRERLLMTGLNTHKTHLTFIPDVPAPTSVTLFNLPMELPDHLVDAALTKYGTIASHYRHKRNFDGLTLLTGLRVYKINIKTSIPKHITIAGHSVKTLYTGQDEAVRTKRQLQRPRPEADTSAEDRAEMTSFSRKMHEVPQRDATTKRQSFLHPDRQVEPTEDFEKEVLSLYDRVTEAENGKLFDIVEETLESDSVVEFTDPKTQLVMEKRPIDAPALVALAITHSYHRLPRVRFTPEYSFTHLTALSYFVLFGYASSVDLDCLDDDVFMEGAVDEWNEWGDYTKDQIIQYTNVFVEKFRGYILVLPKPSM